MNGILENTRVILNMVRGLFRNMFLWGNDLFWNILKGRDSFAKSQKSGRALYRIEGRGGAFGQFCPSFYLPSGTEEGEVGAPAALWPASWATAAAEGRGKRGRAAPGIDSPPQFQRRGPAGAAPRQRAAAGVARGRPSTAAGGSGQGSSRWRRCGLRRKARGGGGGGGGRELRGGATYRPGEAVERERGGGGGRRAARAPLMAFGAAMWRRRDSRRTRAK